MASVKGTGKTPPLSCTFIDPQPFLAPQAQSGDKGETSIKPLIRPFMPTLFRFLFWCAALAGFAYAVLFSLANFVEPRPRDATIQIPSERVNPPE